jgi:hypothetical protein
MESTARPLELVTTPARQSRETFARQVLQYVQQHQDIASEDCWQQFAKLIAEHWQELSANQSPKDSWMMLARCTETILKIRRAARQDQGQSGQEALEEFRDLMREVLNVDNDE